MIGNKKLGAVVLAAGSGLRMKSLVNKPYIKIGDKTVLEISMDTITSIKEIDKIILVIRKDDEVQVEKIIKKYDKDIEFVYGKETREKSTMAGLMALPKDFDLVLTHDGVRPFASKELYKKVIGKLKSYQAVITGTKAVDTIKLIREDKTVEKTPDRDFLYQIQTPQAYDKNLLIGLYQKYFKSDKKITDDSQLFEIFTDKKVRVVEGEYTNIKITRPEDLIFAKAIREDL